LEHRVRVFTLASTRASCHLAANTPARARPRRQKGYLLLELAITLILVAVMGIYTRSVAIQQMDDGVAAATGTYVLAGAAGLETYMLANTSALMNGQAVAGVANALQPTMAELQALSVNNSPMLPNTFPALSPTRQALQFDVQRINNAGIVELRATACLKPRLQWRGRYRDDMVTVAMQSMSGRGGRSMLIDNGATIRGPLITAGVLPNPVAGTPVGILCSVNLLSNAFYSSFARQQDTRPLNFSGAVNVSGGTLTLPAAGAACATAGAIAWLQNGASFLPARCDGAQWVSAGGVLPISAAGDACATTGALAATAQGATLICQAATYVDFVSRMGSLVAMESQIVINGSTVSKPICSPATANAAIYLFPMTDVQTNDTVFRSAVDNTVSWSILIADSTGAAVAGDALAMTYCVY
jgi:type II secretory pathway pseudopilin PulG